MDRFTVLVSALIIVLVLVAGFAIFTTDWSSLKKTYTEATVSEILREPEDFEDEALNITGYLEYRENVHWMMLLPHIYYDWYDSDGDGTTESHMRIGWTWVEKNLWIFHLHEEPTEDSPYITIVKRTSGAYIGFSVLPFWWAPDGTSEELEPGVVNPYEGRAIGDWVFRNVKDHGEMWFLDPDKMES